MQIKLKNIIFKLALSATMMSLAFLSYACNDNNSNKTEGESAVASDNDNVESIDETANNDNNSTRKDLNWGIDCSNGAGTVDGSVRLVYFGDSLNDANKAFSSNELVGKPSVSDSVIYLPVLKSKGYSANDTMGYTDTGIVNFNLTAGSEVPQWPKNTDLNMETLEACYKESPSNATGYAVITWKASKDNVERRALVRVFAYRWDDDNAGNNSVDDNNNTSNIEKDTHLDWDVSQLYREDIFRTYHSKHALSWNYSYSDHTSPYIEPKVLCFFKKSDAEACLEHILNTEYLEYVKTTSAQMNFDIKGKEIYQDLVTDLGKITYIYCPGWQKAPNKSKYNDPTLPNAWLVVTWKEITDNKWHVTLVDVAAYQTT